MTVTVSLTIYLYITISIIIHVLQVWVFVPIIIRYWGTVHSYARGVVGGYHYLLQVWGGGEVIEFGHLLTLVIIC